MVLLFPATMLHAVLPSWSAEGEERVLHRLGQLVTLEHVHGTMAWLRSAHSCRAAGAHLYWLQRFSRLVTRCPLGLLVFTDCSYSQLVARRWRSHSPNHRGPQRMGAAVADPCNWHASQDHCAWMRDAERCTHRVADIREGTPLNTRTHFSAEKLYY